MIKTYLLLFKFCLCSTFVVAQTINSAIHWQSESLLSFQSLATSPEDEVFIGGIFRDHLDQGEAMITAKGGSDIFIAQLDDNGSPIWIQSGGSDRNDILQKIVYTENRIIAVGTYWLTAAFDSIQLQAQGSSQSIFIVAYQSTGSINWGLSIDGTGNKEINDIQINESGEILLAGTFQGRLSVGEQILGTSNQVDFFLLKLDSNGRVLWFRQPTMVSGIAEGISLTVLDNQQIILAGNFIGDLQVSSDLLETNTDDRDIFIASFTQDGTALWAKAAGGVLEDRVIDIVKRENNFYLAGNFLGRLSTDDLVIESVGLNQNIFLLSYDKQGAILWSNSIGGASTETLNAISIEENQILLGGSFIEKFEAPPYEITGDTDALDGFLLSCDLQGNPLWLKALDASQNLILNDLASNSSGNLTAIGDFMGEAFFDGFQFNASVFNPFLLQISSPISSLSPQQKDRLTFHITQLGGMLEITTEHEIRVYQIFDAQGKLIDQHASTTTIPIAHLASGIYAIRMITKKGKFASQWFFVSP